MKRRAILKKILFAACLLAIAIFVFWSKQFLWALFLFFLADCLTLRLSASYLQKVLSARLYTIAQYSGILTFSILLAIFCRTFILGVYFIPSSSMERTLSKGDVVIINRLVYGPVVTDPIKEIVTKAFFSTGNKKDIHEAGIDQRLPGYGKIYRDDIIVFGKGEKQTQSYIKRVIGLPGDTLNITESIVFINGKALEEKPSYVFEYQNRLDRNTDQVFSLSNEELQNATRLPPVVRNLHKPYRTVDNIFPEEKLSEWTRDYYGAVIIPKKGTSLTVTNQNYYLYSKIIARERGISETAYTRSLQKKFEQGSAETYTFQENYYFVLGDNRHFSTDSRAFGYISENKIKGRLWLVF